MWDIFFVLPNLTVGKPFGNEYIAIVPKTDERAQDIISSSVFAKSLVNGFEDQFRSKVDPSLLIVNRNAPNSIRSIDAIVGFRNSFAISCIIKSFEHRATSTFTTYPRYSEYFDFYPITVAKDNSGLITSTIDLLAYDDESRKFRGQSTPGLGGISYMSAEVDVNLFDQLQKAWKRRFIKGRLKEWATRALFRSLEMAYQASAMPFENHSTIYDHGSKTSLWVSAFEILSHPRQGMAGLHSVIRLLGNYEWNNKVVKRRIFRVKYKGKTYQVNLIQKLYKELYDTRNDFLHGNPVSYSRLFPFRNRKVHAITSFAPLIYKVALLNSLEQFRDKRKNKDWEKEYISKLFYEQNLSEAILKSKGY